MMRSTHLGRGLLWLALCFAFLSFAGGGRLEAAAIPQGETIVRVAIGLGQR